MAAKYKRHPLSALFAQFDLSDGDIANLGADIAENGQRINITMHQGMILDGWNRYRGCMVANIEPKVEDLQPGVDPWGFVCSVNMQRRSLTPKQKAAIYLLHNELVGSVQNCTPTVRQAVEQFGLSHGTAQNLTKIARDGAQELKDAVVAGKVSVHNAAQIAALPIEQQPQAVIDKKPAPKAAAPVVVDPEDELGDFDPIEELEALQQRYDEQERKLKSLSSKDGNAELEKQIAMANGLQARLNQELAKNAELDKQLRRSGRIISDLLKEFGIEDDRQILGSIKLLKAALRDATANQPA